MRCVCGMRLGGGQRRTGSEFWRGSCGGGRRERKAFEEWLQRIDRDSYDRYHAQKAEVQKAVKVVKIMANW